MSFELLLGPPSAARWSAGSRKRILKRRECSEKGLCTTCFGDGFWMARRPLHVPAQNGGFARTEMILVRVECTNCLGTRRAQPGDVPFSDDAA